MSGGGLGGAAGTALGLALAPATGGLSMLIPAAAGAAGGYLGGRLTHDENPLMDALMGGIGGGLTGGLSGGFNAANLFTDSADAYGAAAVGNEALSPALSQAIGGANTGVNAATDNLVNQFATQQAGGSASPSILGQLGQYAVNNPLKAALAGNIGLSAIQSVMPHEQVDVAKNRANVMATSPGFDAQLPKYAMQNTATPYNGDWYTYGQSPQAPMYNAMPIRAKEGGLMGYAKGGPVKGRPQVSNVNPLDLTAVHNVGVAIGKRLKNHAPFTGIGQVSGKGGGHDDAVPAKLSQDEYVLSADIPAALGDGSSNEGAKVLDKFVENVRKHKTSHKGKFPPKAKSPLSYLPKGAI